jgi:sarcosine oxidase subunit beta
MRRTTDVVIVGGGCMGASVAYHLTRRGITDIVLVEREAQLGAGSTGRNAGGVRHQFSREQNIRLSIESIAAFERFEEDVGAGIDLHQDGYLFLLSREEEVETFRASASLQRRLGVPVEWLTPEEAARLAPGLSVDGVLAATYCAKDGIADPNGVTVGFARAARAAGADIVRGCEVTGLDVAQGRVAGVRTTNGPVSAPVVVDAAGAWAGQIARMAGVDAPVTPLRRHIFMAQPARDASWDDEPHRGKVPATRILVIDFATSFYFHREGGQLLFGMGDAAERPGFDTTVRWDFLPDVVEAGMARLPALADAVVSHAWAGLYEMTPDAMPIIGPAAGCEGFYVIAGFSGHGFQHSPAAGRVLADLIAGRDPGLDLSPFAADRFAAGTLRGERHFV